jgi:hypothetical protein
MKTLGAMTTTAIRVITSFSEALYRQYAHRLLESFRNWPSVPLEEWKLIVYSEDMPAKEGMKIEFRDLNFPDLVSFKEKYPQTNGDYTRDPSRFAHKVWAMVEGSKDAENLVFWMDADCVIHRRPSVEFLNRLIPRASYMGCFQRPGSYTETGFWGVRADHPYHQKFMQAFKDVYLSGRIFTFPQWHDCYALDYVRSTFEMSGFIKTVNFTQTLRGKGNHPIARSQLGRYIDHCKGSRKDLGYSPENKWHAPSLQE